jgi:pimeloyl-ACP methyl ester carboxylesterase
MEFEHWIPALTYFNYKLIAIDQPGYRKTEGKASPCNRKFNLDKGGPCDVVLTVLSYLNIKRKVIIGGYD